MSGSSPLLPSTAVPATRVIGLGVASAKRLMESVLDEPTPIHSGTTWIAPSVDELAPLFPKYKILRLIGRGGMGCVYLALDTELNRQVAIKILPPQLADQPGFQERFRKEALTLAQLDHQNVVRIHEYGPKDGPLSFVMDYVAGQNLAELLRFQRVAKTRKEEPVPSFIEMVHLAEQICAGLQAAHDLGIVHRDIKPSNIMVTSRGKVKVADFGLAREIVSSDETGKITRQPEVMGTAEYMAPEVLSGASPSPRSDIYSVGVVLYEMFTGELPRGNFPPPSSKAPLHPRVDALVLKAMHHDASQRFPDAASLGLALHRLRACDGKWRRWHRPVAIVAALAIGGVAIASLQLPKSPPAQIPLSPVLPVSPPRLPLAAGLLYEESFDYPEGQSNLPGHGGFERKYPQGSGSDIVLGSLSYVDAAGNRLATKGNSAHVDAHQGTTQIDDITRLQLPSDTPSIIWCSLLAQQTAGTTSRFFNVSWRAVDDTLLPADQGYTDDEILAIGMPSEAVQQHWHIWDRATAAATRRSSITDVPTTQVAFLLLRLELDVNAEGCERFTLWVNPRLDQPPPETAKSFTSAFSNLKHWSDLTKLRLGAGFSDQPGLSSGFKVDEIRLGISSAAVMPMDGVKGSNSDR